MTAAQRGFTLIELVTVVVILGIIAAVALPKFQDLSANAKTAVRNGAIAAFKTAAVITLAKSSGVVPTRASVTAQMATDPAFSFGGTCPIAVTYTYPSDTALNSTFSVDVSICTG